MDRVMPLEWLVSVGPLAGLLLRGAVGSQLPTRTGCCARPLHLVGCATCGCCLVHTHCCRDDPAPCGCCTSAVQTGRTPADCDSHRSGVQSALRAPASPAVSLVPQVQNRVQQGAETRSSLIALQLQGSEVEVLVDPAVRALSGTKQVEVVVCTVVVSLSASDYPQYDRGTLHPHRKHAWCSSVMAVPSRWKQSKASILL